MVVRPYDLFSRAYSSLPTRISVPSSSRTTVASTFARCSPGFRKSSSTRAELPEAPRQRRSCAHTSSRLRTSRQRGWYRYCSAARIASCGLQVTARVGADPDIRPGRRNGQRRDSLECPFVVDDLTTRCDVAEVFPSLAACNARPIAVDVAEARPPRRLLGVDCDFQVLSHGIERRRISSCPFRMAHSAPSVAPGCKNYATDADYGSGKTPRADPLPGHVRGHPRHVVRRLLDPP